MPHQNLPVSSPITRRTPTCSRLLLPPFRFMGLQVAASDYSPSALLPLPAITFITSFSCCPHFLERPPNSHGAPSRCITEQRWPNGSEGSAQRKGFPINLGSGLECSPASPPRRPLPHCRRLPMQHDIESACAEKAYAARGVTTARKRAHNRRGAAHLSPPCTSDVTVRSIASSALPPRGQRSHQQFS
uniref:Uncharacterized protein n=1 Tax=Arundo donax TaxID=35708 RepID=A0A0A9GUR2_ARUDO